MDNRDSAPNLCPARRRQARAMQRLQVRRGRSSDVRVYQQAEIGSAGHALQRHDEGPGQ